MRRPASPATRVPNLKYNTLTETSRTFTEGSILSLERHSDDSLDSPDRLTRQLRSPRVMDSTEARSSDDDQHLAFMDPVSLAAMPSGGQLAPDWMVQNVVLSPRDSGTPEIFTEGGPSSEHPMQTDSNTHSPSSTGEFNLQSIDPATGEDLPRSSLSGGSTATHAGSSASFFLVTSSAPPMVSGSGSASSSDTHERRDSDGSNSSAPNANDSADGGVGDHEDTVKRRLSRRLSTGIGNKQLVKSTKGRQLSKALPQITRAKLNVAAKERQSLPPLQFRIEVVSKDGAVACDPKLPPTPIFTAGPYFREFILTKLVNAERAAYFSQHFAKPIERTRELLFKELLEANK